MSLLNSAHFVSTVVKLARLPDGGLPEVAFVGRSNAGKSTAINTLCGRKRLAFASNTPGRTQALNVFAVGPVDQPLGLLVDTPGYGYAAVPLSEKKAWDQLAGEYLYARQPLVGVALMVDIRRGFTDKDAALIGWVDKMRPLLVLLTKADKVNRQEQMAAQRAATKALEDRAGYTTVVTFSAPKRQGIEEATQWIIDRLT